jgi:peptidyl-prolyl cis-trans isomerase A (cyclophilin A)
MIRTSFITVLGAALFGTGVCAAQESDGSRQNPRVTVETTLGRFVMELDVGRAPLTVEHFLSYVQSGHYEGTIFHRVVHGFVAQGGGFTADLQQKPVERMIVNESGNGLSNLRGTVGMARTTEPHSATAQFYVNLAANADLDPRPTRWGYTVFGTVVEGMEVVDEIGYRPTGAGGSFSRDVPIEPIVIQRITIDSN